MAYYERLDGSHHDKSYSFLISAVRKHLETKRRLRAREELHRSLTGRNNQQVLAVRDDDLEKEKKKKKKGSGKGGKPNTADQRDETPPAPPKRGMKDPCRAYLKGRCDKGTSCKYWHPPDCIFWKKGSCRNGNECILAHLPKEKGQGKGDARDRSPQPKKDRGKGKGRERGPEKEAESDGKPDATLAAGATNLQRPVKNVRSAFQNGEVRIQTTHKIQFTFYYRGTPRQHSGRSQKVQECC